MANKPIKVSIARAKIDKKHIRTGKNGAEYFDFVLWPNREGKDQWDNTHYAVQEISREAREAGEKGPIIGNAKVPRDDAPPQAPRKAAKDASLEPAESDVPF